MRAIWVCSACRAPAGAAAPHTRSTSVASGTGRGASASSPANTRCCRGCQASTRRPSAHTSIGPSTRNSSTPHPKPPAAWSPRP
jgi:hypothetical protein